MTVYSDRDALRHVISQRDTLTKRIAAAIDIHTEDDGRCTYCRHPDGTGEYTSPAWPCPTIRVLDSDGDPGQSCGRGPCALGYGHPGACRC